MSDHRPIRLTERGEFVKEFAIAVLALIILPLAVPAAILWIMP